jgi:hypothetical protein
MDMVLSGLGQAADEFLRVYEAEMGRRVANLGLWELAAAARPMPDPGQGVPEGHALGLTHLTADSVRQALRQFIAAASRRVGVGPEF